MAWYDEVRGALGALIGRRRQESELGEELEFHLEMETRRLVADGLPSGEARRRARLAFGGVERAKEEVRDERGTRWLEDAGRDVHFAWRSLRRRPGFTAVAALTLALGIVATTTLFGVVKAALLEPLPYGSPAGVAMVWSSWTGFEQTWLSYDEWEAYRIEIPAFADVALFQSGSVTLGGDEPERVRSGVGTANLFHVLGVSPILGRTFSADEDGPNGPNVVVLGHRLWLRRFGGDPAIVGRRIEVNGRPTTVLGVMPPGFRLPLDYGADGPTERWTPLGEHAASQGAAPGPAFSPDGMSHGFYGVARLASGATTHAADAQLRNLFAGLVRDGVYPAEMHFRAYTVPVAEQVTGRVRPALLVLLGAVGLVLLIACANVTGLLLVRGEHRRRELAVRVALGAGTRRLARLLLAESAVLAALGGAGGVALAAGGVWLLRRTAPAALPRIADAALDPLVLLFALGTTVCAALLAGVLPALQVTRLAPAPALKEGGRSASSGPGRLRWRQTIVTVEIALAVVLTTGAGLMIRGVANLFAIDPGFRPEQVLTLQISTPSSWYGDSARVVGFWDDLQRRVAALPEVEAVGAVRLLPLATEMGDWGLTVEGYTPPAHQGTPGDWQVVTPGYVEAIGLRVADGRALDARDGLDAPLAMLVNREFVNRYLSGRAPLGTQVTIHSGPDAPPFTIVGIVDDVRHNALTREVKPQFYVTLGQMARATGSTMGSMRLIVRTRGAPMAVLSGVRAAVRSIDPRLPVSQVQTMEEVVGASIAEPRFAMQLLTLSGALALLLSAIGVYGIVSQVVATRTHEYGIRAALGATPRALVLLSVGTGTRQALAGVVLGVALAWAGTRLMTALLHGVRPTDPLTFAAVVAVTGVVAIAATVAPARRAGRTSPNAVLHDG